MKTFNKRGDEGETSLLFANRVPKSDPRCQAYGTIDEAVSALGLARALTRRKRGQNILLDMQKDLFTVAAELATPTEHYPKLVEKHGTVTPEMTQKLQDLIEELEKELEMPKAFIIPGACASSAAMDLARTIIRRAERRVVALKQNEEIHNEELLKYLNRLADLVFTLARYEEKGDGDNSRH
mgnify:CR=1 FL=1